MIRAWELSNILKDNRKGLYFLYGDDFYVKKHAVKEITSVILNKELNFRIFEEDFDLTEIIDAVAVYPIFDEFRAVLIRSDKINNDKLNKILSNCSDKTILIISCQKNDGFKNLPSDTVEIDCSRADERSAHTFVKNSFESDGYICDSDTINLIVKKCGSYIGKINNEIIKLKAYFFDNKKINPLLLDEVVNAETDYEVFELSKALLSKDTKKISDVKSRLLSDGKSPSALLGLITAQFRRMLHSVISDMSLSEIASKLNVKVYAVEMAMKEGKKMSQIKLKKIVDYLQNCEYRFKKGEISDINALESAIDFVTFG